MGSERFPNKSIMDLCGKPMVFRILERVKRCNSIDDLILAIPNSKENEVLQGIADELGVKCYKGSEENLVERFYLAAKNENADIIGRLPADNAVPEPKEIDKIANFHREREEPGFSTNLEEIYSSGFPNGIGAEMFDFSLLEQIYIQKKYSSLQREHIHLNFFDYKTETPIDDSWCKVKTIKCPREYAIPSLNLDVNTVKEGKFIKYIYESLYPKKPEFSIADIINLVAGNNF